MGGQRPGGGGNNMVPAPRNPMFMHNENLNKLSQNI